MRLVIAAVAAAVLAARAPRALAWEGRVAIEHMHGRAGSAANVHAMFSDSSTRGKLVGRDGRCALYADGPVVGLSAGTITITGTTQPMTLHPDGSSGHVHYEHASDLPEPPFSEGATLTIAASGADVPAFTASVTAPAELRGVAGPATVSRAGTTVTWRAGAGPAIRIVLAAIASDTHKGLVVMCRVPDTGSFTIPASTFALIPFTFDRAILTVDRFAETDEIAGNTPVVVEVGSVVVAGSFPVEQLPDRESKPVPCDTTTRLFFSVAGGLGGLSRIGNVPPVGGYTGRIQFGQRLAHRLHLVEELDSIGGSYLSPSSPPAAEDHVVLGAGVRWMAFEPIRARRLGPALLFPGHYVDLRAWYVTAVVGADLRDRITAITLTQAKEQNAWSPMAGLAIGVAEIRGRDWSLGPEFREQLTRFDGHFQRGWQLLVAIDLEDY